MARTQTLVQLSDDLLAQLDARAARETRSRSELIREAIGAYLDAGDALDRQIIDGYTRQPQELSELAEVDVATAIMFDAVGPWQSETTGP